MSSEKSNNNAGDESADAASTTIIATTSSPSPDIFIIYKKGRRVPKHITHAKIDADVETIERYAFRECNQLQEVDCSEATSLKTIEYGAFYRCESLKSFKIGPSVETIESWAFFGCKQLQEVDCNEATSLKTIGEHAFYECESLRSFKIGPSVETVPANAFKDCKQLQEIHCSEATSLKTIGEEAFGSCESLKSFKIGPSVETIGSSAFKECKQLQEIDFSEATSLKTIGMRAFAFCSKLNEVKLGDAKNLEIVGNEVFFDSFDTGYAGSGGQSSPSFSGSTLTIPSSVTSWGKNVFQYDLGGDMMGLQFQSFEMANFFRINFQGTTTNLGLAIVLQKDFPTKITNRRLVDEFYSVFPTKKTELQNPSNEYESEKFELVQKLYIDSIIRLKHGDKRFNPKRQHGWVQFVANHIEEVDSELADKLVDHLQTTKDIGKIRMLAEATDTDGRSALKFAKLRIRKVFEDRLLLFGRYDLAAGAPIHRSATCVVVKAYDSKMREHYVDVFKKFLPKQGSRKELDFQGFTKALQDMLVVVYDDKKPQEQVIKDYFERVNLDGNDVISEDEFVEFCFDEFGSNVVLKFMRNKDQYERESKGRERLENNFVVSVIRQHDEEREEKPFADLLNGLIGRHLSKKEDASKYCYILVMPFGDRSLDTIYRSERPDMVTVRPLAKQVGKALAHLHSCNLLHGDLKMQNVVRVNGRMYLIDLDASASCDEDDAHFVGAKFSSGVLPPQMIHKLANEDERAAVKAYFAAEYKDDKEEQIKRASCGDYVVKSFHPARMGDGLPYQLEKASPSFDIWSFGVLLYQMCSGEPLFAVNRDDDIVDEHVMKELFNWNDKKLKRKLEAHVDDPYARALLSKLLKRNASDRPETMEEVLNDPFFRPDDQRPALEEITKQMQKMEKKLMSELIEIHQVIVDEFAIVKESMQRFEDLQMMSKELLQGWTRGSAVPKLFMLVPKDSPTNRGNWGGRVSSFVGMLKDPSKMVTKEAMLYFICPISLQPGVDDNGEAKGYPIKVPADWIKKHGPAILMGLKTIQFGMAIGRGLGLPLPSLSGIEEDFKETSELFAEMQSMIVEEMGGEEEDGLMDLLHSQFAETLESGASGSGKQIQISDSQRKKFQKSYDGIGTLVEDESFKECGLVWANHKGGIESEYVHPDAKALFEEFGSKCFEMRPEEVERNVSRLSAKARREQAESGITVLREQELGVSEGVVPLQPTQDQRALDNATSLDAKPGITMSALADSIVEQIASKLDSMEQTVSKLDSKIDLNSRAISSGRIVPSSQDLSPDRYKVVIQRGSLSIRNKRFPHSWKDQHFVIFQDGTIMQGQMMGRAKWKVTGVETMELVNDRSPIPIKLRCLDSSVNDWVERGNRWNSPSTDQDHRKDRARSASVRSTGEIHVA